MMHNASKKRLYIAGNFQLGVIAECLDFINGLTALKLAVESVEHGEILDYLNARAEAGKEDLPVWVLLLQLSGWCGGDEGDADQRIARLKVSVDNFLRASRRLVQAGHFALVGITPEVQAMPEAVKTAIRDARDEIIAMVSNAPTFRFVDLQGIATLYEWQDIANTDFGTVHVQPYSREYQALIALGVGREIYRVLGKRFKVIVVDGDNNLWKGECTGRNALCLDAAKMRLQRAMAACAKQGFLVCLFAGHDAEDVRHALQSTEGLTLQEEHITLIDSESGSKSERIDSLSRKLKVSMDSFVLIDDDGFDCADVRFNCPDVVVINAPKDDDAMKLVLRNVWPIDLADHEDRRARPNAALESLGPESAFDDAVARARGLSHIAVHFNSPGRLLDAVQTRKDLQGIELPKVIVAPRTPTEAEVLSIWQSALGIPGIGVDQEFFDLQADSLRAVQILTRVEKRFGVELPLNMLFENAFTIATIAAAVELEAIGRADAQLVKREVAKIGAMSDADVTSSFSQPVAARREGIHG